MIRRYATLATVLLFSLLLTNGNCEDAPDKNSESECFRETEEEKKDGNEDVCVYSRINIKETFYKCESALHLKSSIKRIGFMNEDLLVHSGRQRFLIHSNLTKIKPVRRITPATTQIMDREGNIYYGGSNMVYIQRQRDNEYIDVLTHDVLESQNEIALDETSGKFFILSHYDKEETGSPKTTLYVLRISSLDLANETVNADKVEDLNGVSSISYNPSTKFLYVGLKLPNGEGKLIKLKALQNDPCSLSSTYKEEISNAIDSFRDKIFDVLEKSTSKLESRGQDTLVSDVSDKLLALTWEKEQLENQLTNTMLQLEALRNRFYLNNMGTDKILSPVTGEDGYWNGIQERIGSSQNNLKNGFSLNILISPPEPIDLQLNDSSQSTKLLFAPISVKIVPENSNMTATGNQNSNQIPIFVSKFNLESILPLLRNYVVNEPIMDEPENTSEVSDTQSTSTLNDPRSLVEEGDYDYDFNNY